MIDRAEDRLRRWISRTLTVAVVVAVVVIGIGVAAGIVTGQGLSIGPGDTGVLDEIASGKPGSIVLLGIVALALTPVAQLAAAALAFGRAGEHRYLVVSLVVLALLVGSLVIAALLNPTSGG